MNGNYKVIFGVLAGCVLMGFGALTAQAAVLSGKVAFEGETPAPKPINFGAEKQCAAMHGDRMPVSEELVVNPNRTVKWTLVYVKEFSKTATRFCITCGRSPKSTKRSISLSPYRA
ncbi:MAG: hypothetical protein HYT89_07115 [Candidatus Omnitrophica bacterium]|nr:hypothetical protein [Candidatus Omnitrophota bacterium]